MKKVTYTFEYNTENYSAAVNYDGTNYYYSPMSIEINGKVFILSCGTSDSKSVVQKDNLLYIVSENSGLDYIGMTVINLDTDNVESVYMDSNDINCEENPTYRILGKSTKKQIEILSQYLD